MSVTSYAIALGSNRRTRLGSPARTVAAAMDALGVAERSVIVTSAAVGPAGRAFANAVAILETGRDPDALLADLKAMERRFGRRPGRRWGPRPLDLDIILWSGGPYAGSGLVVPHPAFRARRFVIDPLLALRPGWIDPVSGLTVRQLAARLARRRPVDRPTGRP